MSTSTLKKTGARLGGFTAALALVGTLGVGGASAADTHGDCAGKSNPHMNCTSEPKSDEYYEANFQVIQCAVAGGVASAGGVPTGLGAAGVCLFGSL